jgi:hypothetical protein
MSARYLSGLKIPVQEEMGIVRLSYQDMTKFKAQELISRYGQRWLVLVDIMLQVGVNEMIEKESLRIKARKVKSNTVISI